MAESLLLTEELSLSFGGLRAVEGVTLSVAPGALHALIGPNGAGKTTMFNLLTGVYRPQRGSILLDGKSIVGLRPNEVARVGICRTFQNIRLFPDLTVLENLLVASRMRTTHGLLATVLRSPHHRREEAALRERAAELLDQMSLSDVRDEYARNLPYGHQRRLEIARALATEPRLLLLDEPAAGMNPAEKIDLARLIREVRDRFALTVLLIEHDMGLVMGLAERITVLDHGCIIAEGTPESVQKNPKVIEAYLGTDAQVD